ncbi:MAG: DUF3106 domain-containing protein [Bryobacteraceae bacterium]|jgi:hypothetical protein
MRCDRRRAALFVIPLAILLLAAGPARSQQAPGRPATQPDVNPIDRWNRMSPEQRERELAKLPPARAKRIRQRIWEYNHMRPEQRQALDERYQAFSQLPPERQQVVRERLREFRQLPPARQKLVHREVVQLRSMPRAQRQALLNGDEFRSRFSPQERQIIRDLMTSLPN